MQPGTKSEVQIVSVKQEPELLVREDAARLLGIGARTLARWSAEGKAPAPLKLTPGRRGACRYRRKDLLAWIEDSCRDLREVEGGRA